MTTPAETPAAKSPDDDGCPQWLGAEPCHYVAQKSPSFPVFIRACSCCGRIDFSELARDLAGYAVVPQSELVTRLVELDLSKDERQALVAAAVGRASDQDDPGRCAATFEEREALRVRWMGIAMAFLPHDPEPTQASTEPSPEGPRGGGA